MNNDPCGSVPADQEATTPPDPAVLSRLGKFRHLGDQFQEWARGVRDENKQRELRTRVTELHEEYDRTIFSTGITVTDEWSRDILARGEAVAREIIENFDPTTVCGTGQWTIRQTKALLGMPIMATKVAVGILIPELPVPAGQAPGDRYNQFDKNDFVVTVTRVSTGETFAAHKKADFVWSNESRQAGRVELD